jgi:hypothetical protein
MPLDVARKVHQEPSQILGAAARAVVLLKALNLLGNTPADRALHRR